MKKQRIAYLILIVSLILGLFPHCVLAYTEEKSEYEYADGSLWKNNYFYYGWDKYPEIKFTDIGNSIYISFDLLNIIYYHAGNAVGFDTTGKIQCCMYAPSDNYEEPYSQTQGEYVNGKGTISIPIDSCEEDKIYHLSIYLERGGQSAWAWSVAFVIKNEKIYFDRQCSSDYFYLFNKENIEAYRKLVARLNFYGAGNYLRDYKESYFSALNCDSSEMAKIVTENCSNDYEKVNMTAKWIHDNIVYSISNRIEMADAILERRYGACTEQAILLCAMLNSINIPCVRIQSLRSDHSWNMAYIDNHWVWVDSTWGQWSDNEFGLHMIYTDAEIDNRYKDSKIQNGDDTSQENNANDNKNKGNDSICKVHEWDEGYVILEPTCLIEGTVQYSCKKCYDIKIETLPIKAHDYGAWKTIVPADTESEGIEQRECKYCGNVEKRVIPVVVKDDEVAEKSVATTKKISGIAKKYRLKVGQKMLLKPVIIPTDSTDKLTYKSSKPTVAAVNKKGKVTAIKKGSAIITIKSGKKKIQCKIIVR